MASANAMPNVRLDDGLRLRVAARGFQPTDKHADRERRGETAEAVAMPAPMYLARCP
jgi:hypothetical protein